MSSPPGGAKIIPTPGVFSRYFEVCVFEHVESVKIKITPCLQHNLRLSTPTNNLRRPTSREKQTVTVETQQGKLSDTLRAELDVCWPYSSTSAVACDGSSHPVSQSTAVDPLTGLVNASHFISFMSKTVT